MVAPVRKKKDAWTLATPTPPHFKVGQHLYCGTAMRPGHVRATAHPTTLNSGVGGFGYTCFLAGVFFFALTGTSCLAFFVHNSLRSYLVVLQEEVTAEDSVRLAVSYNPLSSFPQALPTAGVSARILCRLMSSSKKNPTQRIPRRRQGLTSPVIPGLSSLTEAGRPLPGTTGPVVPCHPRSVVPIQNPVVPSHFMLGGEGFSFFQI